MAFSDLISYDFAEDSLYGNKACYKGIRTEGTVNIIEQKKEQKKTENLSGNYEL